MSVYTHPIRPPAIVYPDSDGEPMADNTVQFDLIVTIKGNLEAMFRDDPNVFVAGDLLWYAVEGNNKIRQAPDAMVAFGRPKGRRGSYRQWEEGGIAPQVVFEVLSPGNRPGKMLDKFRFYEQYGVEEYYVYDPDGGKLEGWIRRGGSLEGIGDMQGWVSPRLGIRFELSPEKELRLFRPDGRRFLTFLELEEQAELERRAREQAQQRAESERQVREQAQQRAESERQAREQAQQRAESERQGREQAQQRAESERQAREEAQQRAESEQRAREQAQQQAARLAARLRALGVDPEAPE